MFERSFCYYLAVVTVPDVADATSWTTTVTSEVSISIHAGGARDNQTGPTDSQDGAPPKGARPYATGGGGVTFERKVAMMCHRPARGDQMHPSREPLAGTSLHLNAQGGTERAAWLRCECRSPLPYHY